MTHKCVSKLTIISSDNGLSPSQRQAIIWTNTGILLTGPLGANFSEILIAIYTFWFKKMHFKMSSGKWQPFCMGLNVLIMGPSLVFNINPECVVRVTDWCQRGQQVMIAIMESAEDWWCPMTWIVIYEVLFALNPRHIYAIMYHRCWLSLV